MSQFIAAAEDWLGANTSVLPVQREALARTVSVLLQDISGSSQNIVSISGPPGTGKSTLAHACTAALESDQIPAVVLSLDDYYLPLIDRQRLATLEHPLFAVRGVPGTHDFDLLKQHIDELAKPDHACIETPCFDKSSDDRMVETRMIEAGFLPACIFVEGWVVGVPPQSSGALLAPVNRLEAEQDQDAEWRSRVNACLYDYYQALDHVLTARWYLSMPDWDTVIDWRLEQEMESQQKMLRSRVEVGEFLDHYLRLCQHMHQSYGSWADVIIRFDQQHMAAIETAK